MAGHQAEDFFLALFGRLQVGDRVVVVGRPGNTGQHRRFCEGQITRWLVQVTIGGGLDAVGALAVEDVAQVPLMISSLS